MSGPIIHRMAQGSREWIRARLGRPTSSCFGRIITPRTMKPSTQADRYLAQLIAEWALGIPVVDEFSTAAIERGRILEPRARAWYAVAYDADVQEVGGVTDAQGRYWTSTDGLVGEDGILEIKTPLAIGHVQNMLQPHDIADATQVQGGLWVTGRQWCDMISYNPELPNVVQRVERDPEWMEALDEVMPKFSRRLETLKEELAEKYGLSAPDTGPPPAWSHTGDEE